MPAQSCERGGNSACRHRGDRPQDCAQLAWSAAGPLAEQPCGRSPQPRRPKRPSSRSTHAAATTAAQCSSCAASPQPSPRPHLVAQPRGLEAEAGAGRPETLAAHLVMTKRPLAAPKNASRIGDRPVGRHRRARRWSRTWCRPSGSQPEAREQVADHHRHLAPRAAAVQVHLVDDEREDVVGPRPATPVSPSNIGVLDARISIALSIE